MKKEMGTRTGIIYAVLLAVMSGCVDEQRMPEAVQPWPIRLSVVSGDAISSRAHLYEDIDAMKAEASFGLDAYLEDGSNSLYLDSVWVIHNQGWYFRDREQERLLDYYWPNDHLTNFVAFMPYDLSKSVMKDSEIKFVNDEVTFRCTLPGTTGVDRVIGDKNEEQRKAEHAIHELVYACRKDCRKGEGNTDAVKLRFVHPFAAVKFNLSQSHRNLAIHSIILSGVHNTGTYANGNDTYDTYSTNQDALQYDTWNFDGYTSGNFTVNYEKTVPEDINYYSLIGGPYVVIPQDLSNITLSVNYTWDKGGDEKVSGTTPPVNLEQGDITAWQPGKIYTYTLDMGDNKEEILFRATVEEWTKGEDEGYENEFEVK